MYLDFMHSFPPCELLQFPFDLDLMETLGEQQGKKINISYYARRIAN